MRVTGSLERCSRLFLLLILLAQAALAQEPAPFWKATESSQENRKVYLPVNQELKERGQLIWSRLETEPGHEFNLSLFLGHMLSDLGHFRLLGRKELRPAPSTVELVSFAVRLDKKRLMGRMLVVMGEQNVECWLLITPRGQHSKFLENFAAIRTKLLEGRLAPDDVIY